MKIEIIWTEPCHLWIYISIIMAASGDIWILMKLAQLADRCGVSPVAASVGYEDGVVGDNIYHCAFQGAESSASTPEEEQKIEKMWSLLGLDDCGYRRFDNPGDAEAAVDHALSLAPRARHR